MLAIAPTYEKIVCHSSLYVEASTHSTLHMWERIEF